MQASKKGFTLIELLAVIVILAIILLIATPIILNIIEDVRKGAATSSGKFYFKAVEQQLLMSEYLPDGDERKLSLPITDNTKADVTENPVVVDLDYDENGKIEGFVVYGKYQINFVAGKYTTTEDYVESGD